MDDASNIRGFGIGVVMISLEWLRLEKSLRLDFCASNDEVVYGALIVDLRTVQKLGDEEVEVFLDSKLVVSQIEGPYECPYAAVLEVVQGPTNGLSISKCG